MQKRGFFSSNAKNTILTVMSVKSDLVGIAATGENFTVNRTLLLHLTN